MFILVGNGSAFYFTNDGKYLIGRHVGDIIIGHSTISRKHAEIEIISGEAFLQDCNSKYFTKYRGNILLENDKVKLEDGAEISLGEVQFTFKANEKIVTCSTGLKDNEGELRAVIKDLGGEYLKDWDDTCTHLTTSEIMVTLKVLHALMENKKIVTPLFWKTYLNNIKGNKLPPNPSEFYPPLGENMIHLKYLEYNPNRKNIFLSKTFLFWKKKRQLSMNGIISKAGGKSLILSEIKSKSDHELLKTMINYIVMEPEDPSIEKTYSTILEAYKKTGRRVIPMQEIVLAILQCSCEENCNPHFDRANVVFVRETVNPGPSKIVVGETECFQFESENEHKPEIIPSSFDQEKYFNSQSTSEQIQNESVASTSKRTGSVVTEINLAKKIKLDPEVLIDVPNKKRLAPVFKRNSPEPVAPLAKNLREDQRLKLNPFSAMKLRMGEQETRKREVVDRNLTNNPFGQIRLRKDLEKKNPANDIIVVDDESDTNNDNSKKRKNEDTLDSTVQKKRTKIIIKKNRKFIEVSSIDFSNLNHTISSGTWMDRSIKGEEKFTPSDLDEEEQKWCQRFNNSVVLVAKDLWRKDKQPLHNLSTTSNQTNVKNFKKFRKVFVPKSGHVIKCSKIVYGHSDLGIDYQNSDDEDNRNM